MGNINRALISVGIISVFILIDFSSVMAQSPEDDQSGYWGLAICDIDPYVNPVLCGLTTSTPASSPTPTPTPTSSPTPAPTPSSSPTPRPTHTPAQYPVIALTPTPTNTPMPTPAMNPDTDRAALVALYNSTNGPRWRNRTFWLSDEPISRWFGVTTDTNGRVTELSLATNSLAGFLPPELGNLDKLESLWLNGSGVSEDQLGDLGTVLDADALRAFRDLARGAQILTGEIPPELGNLKNLENLDLSRNRLTGEIPPELGNLHNLKFLDLHRNSLTGEIPPELGNLVNLKERLWLNINNLAGEIPPELGNLHNLEWLDLSRNRLTGEIPPELGNLDNLNRASFWSNNLTGEIPPELGNLDNLERLSVESNKSDRRDTC